MAEASLPQKFATYLAQSTVVSKSLDKFMEEHCHLFAVGGDEQKLNYMELYNQYVALVEQRIAEFLSSIGMAEAEFVEALTGATADPEWEPLQAWLNKTEYAHFASTMKSKHSQMKQAGGDEQVCFSSDEDEDEA